MPSWIDRVIDTGLYPKFFALLFILRECATEHGNYYRIKHKIQHHYDIGISNRTFWLLWKTLDKAGIIDQLYKDQSREPARKAIWGLTGKGRTLLEKGTSRLRQIVALL